MLWWVFLLLVVGIVSCILAGVLEGKNLAQKKKPLRSIGFVLLRYIVLVLLGAGLIYVFESPAVKLTSEKVNSILRIGPILIIAWALLEEAPKRLVYRRYKKKLEKIGVGGSTHN